MSSSSPAGRPRRTFLELLATFELKAFANMITGYQCAVSLARLEAQARRGRAAACPVNTRTPTDGQPTHSPNYWL
ncbi:hypothetical protein EVAR_35723_1 [Eumeta japonica]|uniref:Uncharacterized protein n=1 Tax=Eumeta variegata TaxID=151549 RepID=A0A4C1VF94_EUMVA|nr:hypothetical protein EVAR_35723_1 [Eumeta japonica]